MLPIERHIIMGLGFDLDAAINSFREARRRHALTVGVPAPTAHQLVEQCVHAGGYTVVEPPAPPPEPEPQPVLLPAEQVVLELQSSTASRALVRVLAKRFNLTPQQIIDAIKAEAD